MSRRRVSDYIKAFFTSVRMTARGEKPQALQAEADHPALFDWFRETVALVAIIENAAKMDGVDLQTIVFRLDSRDTTLKIVLDTIRFHAAQEYPLLIHQRSQYALMAIQATNLNDRFALLRASEATQLPDAVQARLNVLSIQLEQLPNT